jgi:hypothetical protein
MDALLILGGVLLIVAALVWLVMLAFGRSLLWGIGSLFPPITLVFVLRHWRVARKAVVLCALGGIPLVVGLTLLAVHDAQRLEAILSLKWLEQPVQKPSELQIELYGDLYGKPFRPLQGDLIGGQLRMVQDEDSFAMRQLKIDLGSLPDGINSAAGEPIRLDILPTDPGPLPPIEISWLTLEQDEPQVRRLNRGYTLHLDLQAKAPNRLQGDLHVILPAPYKTSLSGKIELYRDGLRYRAQTVDRTFDSRDTLTFVLTDYLQRRFATSDVQLRPLPAVTFPLTQLDVPVQAQVAGNPLQLSVQLVKHEVRGWSVPGDRFAPVPLEAPATTPLPQPEAEAQASTGPDRRQDFSLVRLLSQPEDYRNLLMRVQRVGGGTVEGRFSGLGEQGHLQILHGESGAGSARFAFHPDEISRLELLQP